jgi:PIN domain nuclease of toxin-antitoxin system
MLLDTSALLRRVAASERLSTIARDSITVGRLWLSVASYWEIVIKARKGLLEIADRVGWWNRATQLSSGVKEDRGN